MYKIVVFLCLVSNNLKNYVMSIKYKIQDFTKHDQIKALAERKSFKKVTYLITSCPSAR